MTDNIHAYQLNPNEPMHQNLNRILGAIERYPGQTAVIFIGGKGYMVHCEAIDEREIAILPAPPMRR